jgi:dihydrodipicolinate synthase/N-acetylneuraminate lyase
MQLKIKGVIVPTVTPFDDSGNIDAIGIKCLSNYLIERGVAGLFPGGTTGEGPLLSIQERRYLAESFVKAVDGRVPVIMHTGAITTADTLELTQHACSIGAHAAAIITPYYYAYSYEALLHHFETVAHATPNFPIYLYNYPAVAGNELNAQLIKDLIEHCPNIIGLKDSSGCLDTLFEIAFLRNGTFNTAIGNDKQILMGLSMGFDACVSGNANVFPELIVALTRATFENNKLLARELQCKVNAVCKVLRDGSDLSLFKGIMARRGLKVGQVRPPMLQISETVLSQCWRDLIALDL